MHRQDRHRRVVALGLSLAIHALLLAWVLARPVSPPASAKHPRPIASVVWMDTVSASDPAQPARGTPPPVPSAAPSSEASSTPLGKPAPETSAVPPATASSPEAARAQLGKPPGGTSAPAGTSSPEAASAHPGTPPPGAQPPVAGATAPATAAALPEGGALSARDAPRTLILGPDPDALGVPASAAPAPGGRTVYPSDMPSDAELLAEEAARVHDRVDGWARGVSAQARVRGGLPDPAYGLLGSSLREATDEVPNFIDTDSVKEVGQALAYSWQSGAEKYGATGQPYAEPEGYEERLEKPTALGRAVADGAPQAIALSQFFAAGVRLQEFADGRAGAELFALVEIRQQGSGALDSVTLLRPSGVLPFDRWVMERAGAVAKGFLLDAGAREKPYRSVWRFDGLVTFRRKLKPSELDGRAALGMATMAALSLLSGINSDGPRMPSFVGRFDELTGEVDLVDLTNPSYDCRVTLLEAD
ncbi:MAG: hypothetical protein AMXMBFR34_08660 [Myxococcaceae bacterium]